MDVEKIVRQVITLGTLGDTEVGKTQISEVYIENKFTIEHISTIGYNCLTKNIKLKIDNKENNIKIKIWDTTGQERFRSICTQYVKNCIGILLVYAINKKESFENLTNWMDEIEGKKSRENIPIVLIGNKIDLKEEREVSYKEGENFAKKYNIKFFECSAKEGINIKEAFQCLIDNIIQLYKDEFLDDKKDENKDNNNNKIVLNDKKSKNKDGGCCKKKNKENKKENEKENDKEKEK